MSLNSMSKKSIFVVVFTLFEQPPSHALPRSRHGLAPLVKFLYALFKASLTLFNASHIRLGMATERVIRNRTGPEPLGTESETGAVRDRFRTAEP